jgi:hypothetical protein
MGWRDAPIIEEPATQPATGWRSAPLVEHPPADTIANDPRFNTALSPQEESKFREWKAKYAPHDSGDDYDLRGAFKAGLEPDPKTGHWPDTFKKPNHTTFSDQSQYAKIMPERAGRWDGDTYVRPAAQPTTQPAIDERRRQLGLDPFHLPEDEYFQNRMARYTPDQLAKFGQQAKDALSMSASTGANHELARAAVIPQDKTFVDDAVDKTPLDPKDQPMYVGARKITDISGLPDTEYAAWVRIPAENGKPAQYIEVNGYNRIPGGPDMTLGAELQKVFKNHPGAHTVSHQLYAKNVLDEERQQNAADAANRPGLAMRAFVNLLNGALTLPKALAAGGASTLVGDVGEDSPEDLADIRRQQQQIVSAVGLQLPTPEGFAERATDVTSQLAVIAAQVAFAKQFTSFGASRLASFASDTAAFQVAMPESPGANVGMAGVTSVASMIPVKGVPGAMLKALFEAGGFYDINKLQGASNVDALTMALLPIPLRGLGAVREHFAQKLLSSTTPQKVAETVAELKTLQDPKNAEQLVKNLDKIDEALKPTIEQQAAGMEGAAAEAKPVSSGDVSRVSNAYTESERKIDNMPERAKPVARPTESDMGKATAAIVENSDAARNIETELAANQRNLMPDEVALLSIRGRTLKNQRNAAASKLAKAQENGDGPAIAEAQAEVDRVKVEREAFFDVVEKNGTIASQAFSARYRMALEPDYTLADLEQNFTSNRGRKPNPQELDTLKKQSDELITLKAKYEELQGNEAERQRQFEAMKAMELVGASVSKPAKSIPTQRASKAPSKPTIFTDERADAARARLKIKLSGTLRAGIDPTMIVDLAEIGGNYLEKGVRSFAEWSKKMVDEFGEKIRPHLEDAWKAARIQLVPGERKAVTDKIKTAFDDGKAITTPMVTKLAKSFAAEGVTGLDPMLDALHGELKQIAPDITRERVQDIFSGRGQYKRLSKDKIDVTVRDLKGQARNAAHLDDLLAGKKLPKSGIEMPEPSAEQQRLEKLVREEMKKSGYMPDDPETQLKGVNSQSLKGYKTYLANRTAELQSKLAVGDFTPRAKPKGRVLDTEEQQAKLAYEKARQAYDVGNAAARLANRGTMVKALDYVARWTRATILTAPSVVEHLAGGAILKLASSPIEEVIGAGIGKIIPGVASKAVRQGGMNVKAEVHAKGQAFLNIGRDIVDMVKTGQLDFQTLYSKNRQIPKGVLEYPGRVHGALKTLELREEFTRSWDKRMEAMAKEGRDINDPLVQHEVGQKSVLDAEEAIFMEDTGLNSALGDFIKRLERPNKEGKVPVAGKVMATAVRFAIPIKRFAVNLVHQTLQYMFGTVWGMTELGLAMKRGMKNLKSEDAELIMKHLKKGSVGSALFIVGFLNPNNVGGFYQFGQKKHKGDIEANGVRIFGVNISHHLLRTPPIFCLQAGATFRHVYKKATGKGDSGITAAAKGAGAVAGGVTDMLPGSRAGSDLQRLEQNPGKMLEQQFLDRAIPRLITQPYEWATGKKLTLTKQKKKKK